ncbi:SDR family oxidoreductase [Emticicia sp. W12TSBA100-4]|uniref:SDR family NAD(P)-dependent oxidoreductase n=1 Tax=Emticicia sp. W12TSBA100-4 TaxID=3160965 RepID=UPI0033061648
MNKIALVTGGSRGLGKDMAISLAKKNIDVILTYNTNQADAEEVVKTIEASGQKAIALKLDVADIKSFDAFLGQVSEVLQSKWQTSNFDFLINNAGIGGTVPIANMTEEIFDNFVNIHFKGVYFLTQKSLLMMNDGGGVVFISSGTTRVTIPGYSIYSSLKSAVETFTKVVAKEYGNRGIRSNIVAPGPIETDFNDAAIRNNPQMKGFLASQTALGRVGNADDIGSVVAFLCTEDSKWINGQKIEVSGGFFL